MANSDKNILITPNTSTVNTPSIAFTGASNVPVTLSVKDAGNLAFTSSVGQLLEITPSLTGTIMSVNDQYGIPLIDVNDSGAIRLSPFTGSVSVGTSISAPVITATQKLIAEEFFIIALSDETTSITTGVTKVTVRIPYSIALTQIPRAYLSTASTSGNPTIDIKLNGTSILGVNKLSIDVNEKTSVSAATLTTLTTTVLTDDLELTFDVTVAGTGAKGLKVTLYYKRV